MFLSHEMRPTRRLVRERGACILPRDGSGRRSARSHRKEGRF